MEKKLPVLQSLSYSRRQLLRTCPRKFWLRYEMGLESKTVPYGRIQGQCFSNRLESFFNGVTMVCPFKEWIDKAPNQETVNKLLEAKAIANLMADKYITHYGHMPDDMVREVEFSVPIAGSSYVNRGMIDGLSADNSTLYEDKLYSSFFWRKANEEQLKLDEQVTAYFAACRAMGIHIERIVYRATLKPALRRRKDELRIDYVKRISEAVDKDPDKYMREYILTRTEDQVDDIQHEIEYYAGLLDRMKNDDFFPKNTGACADYGGCEFLPLCAGEVTDLSELYTRKDNDDKQSNEQN